MAWQYKFLFLDTFVRFLKLTSQLLEVEVREYYIYLFIYLFILLAIIDAFMRIMHRNSNNLENAAFGFVM